MKKLFTICSYGGGYFLFDQSRKEERTGVKLYASPFRLLRIGGLRWTEGVTPRG